MTGNSLAISMKACILTVLFLAAVCRAANLGESCKKDSDCGERMECVIVTDPTTTPQPHNPTTTEADDSDTTEADDPDTTEADDSSTTESNDDDEYVPRRHLLSLNDDDDNKKCMCSSDYVEIDKKCRIELTEDLMCEKDDDCELIVKAPLYNDKNEKGTCVNSTCTCGNDHWQVALNETTNTYMCYSTPSMKEDSDPPIYVCQADQECAFLFDDLRNTTAGCNGTSVCTCDDDKWQLYTNDDSTFCARILDAQCDNSEQCSHIEHADCSDNKCKCNDGYNPDEDDENFKCSGASTLLSSVFVLLAGFWLTKESQ